MFGYWSCKLYVGFAKESENKLLPQTFSDLDEDGPPRTEPFSQEVLDAIKERSELARIYLEKYEKLPCCIED